MATSQQAPDGRLTTAPTPGPWLVREQGDANHYVVLTADGRWLAMVQHNGEQLVEQQRANLAAMAASSAMLNALAQWAAAERMGDAVELENARHSRDAAIAAAQGALSQREGSAK